MRRSQQWFYFQLPAGSTSPHDRVALLSFPPPCVASSSSSRQSVVSHTKCGDPSPAEPAEASSSSAAVDGKIGIRWIGEIGNSEVSSLCFHWLAPGPLKQQANEGGPQEAVVLSEDVLSNFLLRYELFTYWRRVRTTSETEVDQLLQLAFFF